jgi:hypothetical protein
MPKPTRLHYAGVACFIDDIDMDRVQAVGTSTRFNFEEVFEHGNLNIVEIIDDVSDVEVTIDTNEYGSNKTLGAFANKPFGCRIFAVPTQTQPGQDKVLLEEGRIIVNGVPIHIKRAIITIPHPALPDSCVISLKTDPNADPQYTVTFNQSGFEDPDTPPTPPAGEIKIAEIRNVPTTGIVTQDMITDTRTWGTIKLIDFELAKADIYIPMKPSTEGGTDEVDRTCYMENVYLTRIDMNYSVDGMATENYAGETDNKRYFINDAKHVIKEQFVATASQATQTLTYTPTQLLNGNYMLKVVKNGQELKEGVDFNVEPATKTITFTSSLVAGDQVLVRYTSSTGGVFHDDSDQFINFFYEDDTKTFEQPGGVNKGRVEIYLTEGGTDKILTRVQSCRITANFNRERLPELGSKEPYARPATLPFETTAALEFTDSDLEMLARLTGYQYNDGVITGTNELDVNDILRNRGLRIKIYRVSDDQRAKLPANHPWQRPLKEIVIPYLIPTDEAWNSRVRGNATQTYNFRTHDLQIVA